jgi:acyl-CoA thioesterase I
MAATQQTVRICFVGDSYVAGTGDADCLGWVGRVCRRAWRRGDAISFYNLGIRGDTTELVARRWHTECLARLPEGVPGGVVFSFGINDVAERIGVGLRVAPERSVEVAETMLSEAARLWPTIWIGPPPANEAMSPMSPLPGVAYDFRNERLMVLNRSYVQLAARLGVPYLDIASRLSDDARYRQSLLDGDLMHCSGDGYGLIADLVDAWPAWRGLLRTAPQTP